MEWCDETFRGKGARPCNGLAQSCLTLCDTMDYSPPPASSVHGILQARILEWVAIPFSSKSSQPRNQTWVSHIASRFFTIWAIREAPLPPNKQAKFLLVGGYYWGSQGALSLELHKLTWKSFDLLAVRRGASCLTLLSLICKRGVSNISLQRMLWEWNEIICWHT